MDRATVLEQLKEVAVDVLGVDPGIVSETSSFKDDLDADSLDLVEVVMALEERFSISVPEDKLDGITTVGEAVDLVLGIADPAADGAPAAGGSADPAADGAPASDGETAAAGEPAESADRA
ncbi:MAG: acyl carrier protein [Actinomycetota bacterium]|jgi:acyl carrier protein|nr:acyl carrier protein [Actinomycetota bacterium]